MIIFMVLDLHIWLYSLFNMFPNIYHRHACKREVAFMEVDVKLEKES